MIQNPHDKNTTPSPLTGYLIALALSLTFWALTATTVLLAARAFA